VYCPNDWVHLNPFVITHFFVAFSVAYLFTGDVLIGSLIAMVEPAINTVAYFFHEKIGARRIGKILISSYIQRPVELLASSGLQRDTAAELGNSSAMDSRTHSYMEMDCRKEGVRRTIRPFAFLPPKHRSLIIDPLPTLPLCLKKSHYPLLRIRKTSNSDSGRRITSSPLRRHRLLQQ
jgi:uncharacterized membrane protein